MGWFVKALFWCVYVLPMPVQMALGRGIGILWFDILRIRRREALAHLQLAFPDWSLDQRQRVARKSCYNLGLSFVEFCRFPFVKPSDRRLFTIEGLEHLERALAKGKGVMLLSQHIGNGDWATVGLSLYGVKLHIITKRLGWEPANDLWFSLRKSFGTELIEDRNTSLKILKALKRNEIVAYVLDQFMGPPIGVRTTFFGHPTGTPAGLAVLTRRSGAAVVPIYTVRRDDGHTVVHFDPEVPFVESADPENTVQDMTQVYCDKIETYVRQFPEQWMWVHRRWKEFRE